MHTQPAATPDHDPSSPGASHHVDALALATAAAVVAAAVMLALGIFGAVGVYESAVEAMQQWHLFFEPTVVGTIAGIVEAMVSTFVLVYAFAWLYNTLARRRQRTR